MDLGKRIRRAREAADLDQPALAQRVGVSVTTIRNWENGHTTPRNKLGKLETELRVNLTDIENRDDRGRDDVTLREATESQLFGELSGRLADLDTQVRELTRKLADLEAADPTVLRGPWAARSRPNNGGTT